VQHSYQFIPKANTITLLDAEMFCDCHQIA